jgi:hypothetical protein
MEGDRRHRHPLLEQQPIILLLASLLRRPGKMERCPIELVHEPYRKGRRRVGH